MAAAPRLVIGIDVGTTSTGVSYHVVGTREVDVLTWQVDQEPVTKIPTAVLYARDGTIVAWGIEALKERRNKPTTLLKEWFKVDFGRLSDTDSQANVDRYFQDYLRLLYREVSVKNVSEIRKKVQIAERRTLKGGWWESLAIRFVFTVPAPWTYSQAKRFKETILSAGFGGPAKHTVEVILTEPHAAVIYQLQPYERDFRQKEIMKVLVVDAGGGTTDICRAEVQWKAQGPMVIEKEPVTGEYIGATHIDSAFEAWVKLVLQPIRGSLSTTVEDAAFHIRTSAVFQDAKHMFRQVKEAEQYVVKEVPGLNNVRRHGRHVENGCFVFTDEDIRPFFKEQFEGIRKEIAGCIDRAGSPTDNFKPDYIFLSGGLGGSAYIVRKVKQLFEGSNTRVVVPPAPRLAVCFGVGYFLAQFPDAFPRPLCRESFGVVSPRSFVEVVKKGKLSAVLACKAEPGYKEIDWIIKKGDPIPTSFAPHEYSVLVSAYKALLQNTYQVDVVRSLNNKHPPFVNLDCVTTASTHLPFRDFEKVKDGILYRTSYIKVEFSLRLTMDMVGAELECVDSHGRQIGALVVPYKDGKVSEGETINVGGEQATVFRAIGEAA